MQFDFGQNWADFSANVLDKEKMEAAKKEFATLMEGHDLSGKSFLDIGFGQGMSLLFAAEKGASACGCDINPKCDQTLQKNRTEFFDHLKDKKIPVVVGSVLDKKVVDEIKKLSPDGSGTFDMVHSWGVLHHTGNMQGALEHASELVKPGSGLLVIAIYNRHWTSPVWTLIKWTYCKSPALLKRLYIACFYPVIWLAKLAVTGKNPANQQRGMDFYYNVIDWVGGYPYEYASLQEMKTRVESMGYTCVKSVPAEVPIGCNEFIFIKKK